MRERIFETEKVSKPSVREAHGKVKESLKNEDGWSEEIVDILEPPIEEVEELAYELRNTVRGAKTGVDDVDGLIDHCEHIMSRLDDAIDDLEDNSDDLNESDEEWHDTADREQADEPDYIPDEMDRYEAIAHKTVYDSDGFTTDYTLYFDHDENNYFTVFGDNDLYGPEDSEHDWDFGPNEDEALEWFEDYEGFIDDEDVDLELTDDDLEAGQWYESLNETLGVRAVSLDEVLKEAEELAKDLLQTRGAKEQREDYARDVYYTYAGELKPVAHKGSDGRDYVYTDANKNHYKLNLKYITSALHGNLAPWYANAIRVDDISPIEWQRAVDKMIKDKFVEKYEVLDESLREGLLYRDNGAGLAEKGYLFTIQELGKIYDDSVKAKDPVVMEYKNFSDWMNDTVESGLLEIVDERAFDESCNEKLIQSSSDKAFKKNIATEIKAGKDPKQAAAIAYSIKRKNESKGKGMIDVLGDVKESVSTDAMHKLEGDGWTVLSHGIRGNDSNHYWLARKMNKDLGKAEWKAINDSTGEVIDITYEQALGREPVGDSAIANLSKRLGKILLPKREGIQDLDESLDISDEDFQQKLKNELQGKLQYHYKKLGYTQREIEDYIMPVYKTEFRKGYGDDGSDALFVWVGAEVDYDELEELAQILNRVIRKYDKDAYFEPETSGRLISVLWN